MKITKTTRIEQIMANYPKLGKVLVEKYGLHCLGCQAAYFETLEQGARAHGIKNKEIEKMIKELNSKLQVPNYK